MVLARHVVGHEVDDDFQAAAVSTLHQVLELFHTFRNILRQIGIHIIIIFNGIRGAGLSFDNGRMIGLDIVTAVIGLGSMLYDACVPNMRCTELFYLTQCLGCKISHFATSVFSDAAVVDTMVIVVSE